MKSNNCMSVVGMLVLALLAVSSFGSGSGSSSILHISVSRYRLAAVLQMLMKRLLLAAAMVLLTNAAGFAQVTIKNEKHRDLPIQKVDVLYLTACQVAAEKLHVPPLETQFHLTLVMGEVNERMYADNILDVYKIYMDNWNEEKFVSTLVMIETYRLFRIQRYKEVVVEILRRANEAAPVSVADVRSKKK